MDAHSGEQIFHRSALVTVSTKDFDREVEHIVAVKFLGLPCCWFSGLAACNEVYAWVKTKVHKSNR